MDRCPSCGSEQSPRGCINADCPRWEGPERVRVCGWDGCRREPMATVNGNAHAHCAEHEARLLRELFGPVSWHDRARTNTLPALVIGGRRFR